MCESKADEKRINQGLLRSGLTFTEIKEWAKESQTACNEALYYCKNIKSVQYLIDNKADLNTSSFLFGNSCKKTPLWYYCLTYDRFDEEVKKELKIKYEIIKLLIKNGADVNEKDEDGQTILFQANNFSLIKLLLESGVDVNSRDNCGNTFLCIAYAPNLNEMLLEHGADVNSRNNEGNTPLFFSHHEKRVLLLEYDADIDAKDNNGNTMLNNSYKSSADEIYSLIRLCGDINSQNNEGNTILHKIAGMKKSIYSASIHLLLSHGADPNIKNNKGETPHDYNYDAIKEYYESS